MSVFRVEKSKNYTVMSNHHLRNTELSLRAKGLLSQILSLPEGWDYTIAGLANINKEGKDAVRAAVQELEKAGYIERRQTMDSGGKFGGNEYVVYESPRSVSPLSENPSTVNPSTEKPSTGKPLTENPTQLNKDISSKEIYTPYSPPEGDAAPDESDDPPKEPEGAPPEKNRKRKRDYQARADTLPERFEDFWTFYRKHVPPGSNAGSRQKAIRAWDKLEPDSKLVDEMMECLQAQVRTQRWRSGVGVPHASTWLNGHGWEDDWGRDEVKDHPDILPERFEKFFAFFQQNMPSGKNAGNRQLAIRAWDDLAPDSSLANKMAAALSQQVASKSWQSGDRVPSASFWLSNRGWEDFWGAAPIVERPDYF